MVQQDSPFDIREFRRTRRCLCPSFHWWPKVQTTHFTLIKCETGSRRILENVYDKIKKEVLQVDEAEDQVLLTAFQAGLRSEDFLFSITKNPPGTMADLLLKAQKYMNAKDVLASKGITKRPRKEKESEDRLDRRKEGKLAHSLPNDYRGHFTNFTPLVMPPSKILMHVKNDPILRWPCQ